MRRLTSMILLLVLTAPAFGWSEAGHKIIGSIAFRQLTPDQQAKVVAILKSHPRWEEDFKSKMPAELITETEQNEWAFQQAAIWPDMARGFQGDARKFNHPSWHYINLPIYLTDADRTMDAKVNTSFDPPAAIQEDMDVVQAIRFARRLLVDQETVDADKAVLLCWIFHDVGDIHQPLHSCALFAKTLFPSGDRGGNSIKTDQRQNLHAVWDQFPGNRASFREARNKAIAIVSDSEQTKIGNDAASRLDEKTWLDESYALAESTVYDSEVTGFLRGYAAENDAPALTLTERYLKQGGAVSEKRVVEAGYRLGAVLKQISEK